MDAVNGRVSSMTTSLIVYNTLNFMVYLFLKEVWRRWGFSDAELRIRILFHI